jgi:hypothetical protein
VGSLDMTMSICKIKHSQCKENMENSEKRQQIPDRSQISLLFYIQVGGEGKGACECECEYDVCMQHVLI